MAEKIGDEFPGFRSRCPRPAEMARWAAEGGVWRLERGVDFEGDVGATRGTLGSWSSSHGYRLRTSTKGQPDGVLLVQFIPKDSAS